MGNFYILFTLLPCVIGQLQERWLRQISKKWITRDATVTEQTLTGVWTKTVEICYQFEVAGETHEGKFRRRYQSKNSADSAPIYEPGARVEIRVDPKNPNRSYFPLPLSVWGLLYAAPIAALIILAVLGGVYTRIEQQRFDAKHRIPASEWKRVRYSRLFNISFPGDALYSSGAVKQMAIDGSIPQYDSWVVRREGYSFEAVLFEYPAPLAPDTVFSFVRRLNHGGTQQRPTVESPLIYLGLKAGRPFTWPEATGRLFGYSQPDWTAEVYVAGRSVYVISTSWYVQSDVRAFFDSLQPAEGLN